MTLDEARNLHPSQTVYHVMARNADGSPLRARVNGNIRLWKTQPHRIQVPMKHGLRSCFYLTEENLDEWLIDEPA